MAPNHIKFKGSNFFFKENQGAALSLTTPATNPPIKDHIVVKLQKAYVSNFYAINQKRKS
jgi:hypothetical protein